ncbi:MAG: hypothetical protein NW220_01045 [Leptolyngbyaceae cyanobacterium bins.349]|nr:hypothetical protein [Leptolyngbyaceae cyanobacterium bins.349]
MIPQRPLYGTQIRPGQGILRIAAQRFIVGGECAIWLVQRSLTHPTLPSQSLCSAIAHIAQR